MHNLIGATTGAFFTGVDSIDKQISVLKKLNLQAIEVIFAKTSELNQKISPKTVKYLKSIKYVSIHTPFLDAKGEKIDYKNDRFTKNIIKKTEKFYYLFNAKAVVFHPHRIKDWNLLKKSRMNICMENMPEKVKLTKNKLKKFFIKHPNYNLVLDTAHALTFNVKHLNDLIDEFKNRINHVHFSDRCYSDFAKKVRDHEQLLFCKDIHKFDKLKELSCPIIIEVSIKDKKNDLSNLKEEIDCVERFFNKTKT